MAVDSLPSYVRWRCSVGTHQQTLTARMPVPVQWLLTAPVLCNAESWISRHRNNQTMNTRTSYLGRVDLLFIRPFNRRLSA